MGEENGRQGGEGETTRGTRRSGWTGLAQRQQAAVSGGGWVGGGRSVVRRRGDSQTVMYRAPASGGLLGSTAGRPRRRAPRRRGVRQARSAPIPISGGLAGSHGATILAGRPASRQVAACCTIDATGVTRLRSPYSTRCAVLGACGLNFAGHCKWPGEKRARVHGIRDASHSPTTSIVLLTKTGPRCITIRRKNADWLALQGDDSDEADPFW